MPAFKQNTSNMRVFRQGTEKVEDVRNAVQDLNHEIDKLVAANRLRPLFRPIGTMHQVARYVTGTEDQPTKQCEGASRRRGPLHVRDRQVLAQKAPPVVNNRPTRPRPHPRAS